MRRSANPDSTFELPSCTNGPSQVARSADWRDQGSDPIRVRLPQRAVGRRNAVNNSSGEAGIGPEFRRVHGDVGHGLRQERVGDVDASLSEHPRKNPGFERGAPLVARIIAGDDLDRRGEVLVVEQREESSLERRVGARHAEAGRGKPGEDRVAHADARGALGRRDTVDNQLGAAVVHEVMG